MRWLATILILLIGLGVGSFFDRFCLLGNV